MKGLGPTGHGPQMALRRGGGGGQGLRTSPEGRAPESGA